MNKNIRNIAKQIIPFYVWNLSKNILFHKTWIRRESYSQDGQDSWVINDILTNKKNGYFIEIGSFDGITINNTYMLEKYYNWSGICVEPNPKWFKALVLNRKAICLNTCVDSKIGTVDFVLDGVVGGIHEPEDTNLSRNAQIKNGKKIIQINTITLKDILKKNNAPKVIDYLSIDTEGAEERILSDFPFDKYKFLTMTIERPSPNLKNILAKAGYIIDKENPNLDTFFVHNSISKKI